MKLLADKIMEQVTRNGNLLFSYSFVRIGQAEGERRIAGPSWDMGVRRVQMTPKSDSV